MNVCFSFLRLSHTFTFRLIGLIASTAMLHAEKEPGATRPDFIRVEHVEVHVAPRNTGIGIHGAEPSLDSRVGDTIIVRGHYKLTTQQKARLSFVQTVSKRKAFQLNLPMSWIEVRKGSHEFQLSCQLAQEGLLFLTFFSIPEGTRSPGSFFVTQVLPAWGGIHEGEKKSGETAHADKDRPSK